MKEFIPVNLPMLNGNEKKYLNECIDSGWISSEGPFVEEFERKFAAFVGRKHAIAVCNGTAAIDAAVEALGIGPGDEVIMPAFTIISCLLQIVRSGAIPVLVDSDALNWNMDVSEIEKKITAKTKAIMVVHIYGLPVDMTPVIELAECYGLKIIEDAAEMHGQTYHGRRCGSFGDISTFSFYPNKLITTGEGGMILTDDDELANTCRSLRNLCFEPSRRFVHERLGWNFRMTNLQAALGLAQLERVEEFVLRKREIGNRYNNLLEGIEGLQLPIEKTCYAENIYWIYGIVLRETIQKNAAVAIQDLQKLGVGCRPFFCPMNMQPILQRMGLFINETYPVAESLYERGFYIPSGLGLQNEQIDKVGEILREYFNT